MKQTKSFEIDMCNGTLMDKLISFSIPLMLSGILQLMFNAVDIIVVGRFAGSESLAAARSMTSSGVPIHSRAVLEKNSPANAIKIPLIKASVRELCTVSDISRSFPAA